MLRLLIVALAVTVAACGPALARLDPSDMRDLASHAADAKAADKVRPLEPAAPEVSRPAAGWLGRPSLGSRDKTVIAIETGALVVVSSEAGVKVTLVQQLYLALISQVDETEVAVIAVMPETCALRECAALEAPIIIRVAHAALATRSGADEGKAIVAMDQRGKDAVEPEPEIETKAAAEADEAAANLPPDRLSRWLEDYGTFLLGLVGTALAGVTTWFTVAHIRHQIRVQPAGAPSVVAAPAVPLASVPPTPGPKRRRARSASTTPASRKRSREAQE